MVDEALRRGHSVTAFSRTPQLPSATSPSLRSVRGDFHDAASLRAAVAGQDAVIITASPSSRRAFKENPNYLSEGTRLAIEAMHQSSARRLSILSAIGTGETKRLLSPPVRWLVAGWLLKASYDDHERQESVVRASGLDWVIVRPARLTNGRARRQYLRKIEIEPMPSAISRADVADFLVESIETDTWTGKAVQIGG